MLEIVMTVICIVLLFNLVIAMVVMGHRSKDNSWLLALLLTLVIDRDHGCRTGRHDCHLSR